MEKFIETIKKLIQGYEEGIYTKEEVVQQIFLLSYDADEKSVKGELE